MYGYNGSGMSYISYMRAQSLGMLNSNSYSYGSSSSYYSPSFITNTGSYSSSSGTSTSYSSSINYGINNSIIG